MNALVAAVSFRTGLGLKPSLLESEVQRSIIRSVCFGFVALALCIVSTLPLSKKNVAPTGFSAFESTFSY